MPRYQRSRNTALAFLSPDSGESSQLRREEDELLAHDILFEAPDPAHLDPSLVIRRRPNFYAGQPHYEFPWVEYPAGIRGMVNAAVGCRAPRNPYTLGTLARALAEAAGAARWTDSQEKGHNRYVYPIPGGYAITADSTQIPSDSPCLEVSDIRKRFRTLRPQQPLRLPEGRSSLDRLD